MPGEGESDRDRRILCVHLPHLLSEITEPRTLSLKSSQHRSPPIGLVLVESRADQVRSTDRLDAVNPSAHRAGIRAGQTITEARALVAELQVEMIEQEDVELRLIAIAEVASPFGTTVSWQFPDTVWVDTTGVSHLYGGEEELALELQEQVRLLGHVARVCVASGPRISQAIAHFGTKPCSIVAPERTAHAMGKLPILALPLSQEKVTFLSRLGLLSVEQLQALPPAVASSRLGEHALEVLTLAQGIDKTPLVPGQFPRVLLEEIEWEEPAFGLEPLLFALRGLLSRLSARLRGRGEACSHIELRLKHDPAIARHRGVLSQTLIEFELSTPLYQEGDLERALKSRLSRLEMKAPTIGLRLSAEQLSPAFMDQMGLSEAPLSGTLREAGAAFLVGQKRIQELALLLCELEADVGQENLGTLAVRSHLRPEARSLLEPVVPLETSGKRPRKKSTRSGPSNPAKSRAVAKSRAASKGKPKDQRIAKEAALYLGSPSLQRITRLVKRPRPLGTPLTVGASFGMGSELYTIESLRFIQRLDGVEWWTPTSTSRDYFWAWLKSPRGGAEALLFIDRNTQETFLQAWGD